MNRHTASATKSAMVRWSHATILMYVTPLFHRCTPVCLYQTWFISHIHIHIHLAVQDRVVSHWLCGGEGATQGKVVLSKLRWIPEEAKKQMILHPHAALLVCRPWLWNVVDVG